MSLALVDSIAASYGDAQTTTPLNFSLELKGPPRLYVKCFSFLFFSVDKEKNSLHLITCLGQPQDKAYPPYQKPSQLLSYMHTFISSLSTAPFNSLDTQRMRNYHTCSQSII